MPVHSPLPTPPFLLLTLITCHLKDMQHWRSDVCKAPVSKDITIQAHVHVSGAISF